MSPFGNSILAAFFVVFAFGCVLSMLESWGNKQTRFSQKSLTIFHRTCGYLFITAYLFLLYIMLQKIIAATEPISPLAAMHVVLAVLIFPVLMVKILIIRRFKGLIPKLPYFGILIFSLALTFNVVTAGFFFVRSITTKYVSLTSYDKSKLSIETGRELLNKKCVKCHTLERVYSSVKTEEGWTKTVNTMLVKDPTIDNDQAVQVIYYLTSERSVLASSKGKLLVGMKLTDEKCGRCHQLMEIYRVKRTKDEWSSVVDNMQAIEPEWISNDESSTIKDYLYARHTSDGSKKEARFVDVSLKKISKETQPPPKKESSSEEFFKEKCLSCHNEKRILNKAGEIAGDKEKWTSVVNEMIDNGAELEPGDINKIVAYLQTLKK